MADDDKVVNVGISHRGWLGALSFTAVVVLLVALGSTESLGVLTAVILAAVFGAAGIFLWVFPGSRFFVLTFTNCLAIYSTVYTFLLNSNFTGVAPWAVAVGYLLPIYIFLGGVVIQRDAIREMSRAEELRRASITGRKFLWLVPMLVISGLTFTLPLAGLGSEAISLILVGAMAVIAVFVAVVCRQISLFLIDTGLLFDQFFLRMGGLFRPVFAFFTLYSFVVIVFAMIFRIMDRMAATPIFLLEGIPDRISFNDSLYFSLITMSTVGYGDITPNADAVRVVAAVQIMLGILLFLFGFAEIMRYAREMNGRNRSES